MRRRRRSAAPPATSASAGWDDLDSSEREVAQICHPEWRGVRTAAYAFGDPVIETTKPDAALAREIAAAGVQCVVVHAAPDGTSAFIEEAARHGVSTRQVFHSSMAQHGTDAGEAEAVVEAFRLRDTGALHRVGFVKQGVAEAFSALGYDVVHVPNRTPRLPAFEAIDLGEGLNVGVFHDPYWRKNPTTQLAATAILGGRAHVMRQPTVGYLDSLDVRVHGVVPWDRFIALQGSVDLNLYVTLSESHPMSPMESYLARVPCVVSRTSELFRDDDELRDLTTVDAIDDPSAIADAARRLLDDKHRAIDLAQAWMKRHDLRGASIWHDFTH